MDSKMDVDENPQQPGGFIIPSLPSPAPSSFSSTSTSSNLPHPRSHPLRAGSAKEDAARRYVEGKLLIVSRRYTKKFQPEEDGAGETVKGYISMGEVAKDLSGVVDVLWLSGTPSLQIPYLLNIAGAVNSYLPSFPPSPKATFSLLRKLDHAFSSLLRGEDSVTGEVLPGFEGGLKKGMSKTDMVRVKNLVQDTRVLLVDVMSRNQEVDDDESTADTDVDMTSGGESSVTDDVEDEDHGMDIARVYEDTIVRLGELLQDDGVAIGIPNYSQR